VVLARLVICWRPARGQLGAQPGEEDLQRRQRRAGQLGVAQVQEWLGSGGADARGPDHRL